MTLKQFMERYGINANIEEMHALLNKSNEKKGFAQEDGVTTPDQKHYVDTLKHMLSACIVNHLYPTNIKAGVTLEYFDFAHFIQDYEEAQQAEYDENSVNLDKRTPFEGVKSQAFNEVLKQTLSLSRSLPDIWSDFIRNGANLEDFRRVTIEADKDDLIRRGEAVATDLENQQQTVQLNNSKSYILTLIAYDAMDRAIDKRTIWWRLNPFNWKRWREEKRYMRELEEKIDRINRNNLDFTEAELYLQCTGPVLSTAAIENFDSECREVSKEKPLQNNGPKLNENFGKDPNQSIFDMNMRLEFRNAFQKQKDDLDSNASLTDELSLNENEIIIGGAPSTRDEEDSLNLFDDDQNQQIIETDRKLESIQKPKSYSEVRIIHNATTNKTVMSMLVDALNKSDETMVNKYSKASSILQTLLMNIGDTWKPNASIGTEATKMFTGIYKNISNSFPKMDVGDRLVAAQKMTNVMLKVYSPAASDKALARYGNNYAIKYMDNDDIQKLTGYQGNVDELMNNVKNDLGIKTKVEIINDAFGNEVSDKSDEVVNTKPPVSENARV